MIESILLGIPIPPIFVSQRADGVWDVVDGLQRLSTIYQFVGILTDEAGAALPPLVLEPTKYLPSLAGKLWESNDEQNSLTTAQRLAIKRSKIDVSIILKESDENTKYELFQRLNTGGTPLSPQEVRNSILVMLDRNLYQWMRTLSQDESFREVTALSDRAVEEQYDMDLVTRFVVFRNLPQEELTNIGEMGEFLTDRVMQFARTGVLDKQVEEQTFRGTFALIKNEVGNDAFRRFDVQKQRFLGGFLVSAFEVVALGIGHNFPGYLDAPPTELRASVTALWSTPEFTDNSGSGVRASSRVPHTMSLGRTLFSK